MSELRVLNGPDIGRSFQLKEGHTSVGRSRGNDVQIKDRTVSRLHLRISRREDRYFLTDLGTQNGTFYGGKYLHPGVEVEVKEGAPIAIGMTIVCIGQGSMGQTMPFLDSVGLTKETGEDSGIFVVHREKTNQRKLEFIYKVSDLLTRDLPRKDTLERVLDLILELLVRLDRAAFILVDSETKNITHLISRLRGQERPGASHYPLDLVYKVIQGKEAVMIPDSQGEGVENGLATTLKLNRIFSIMCVPMMTFSQLFGVVYLDSMTKAYGFRKEDLSLFQDIAQRTAAFLFRDQFSFEPPHPDGKPASES
jgi:adenylate cyclase